MFYKTLIRPVLFHFDPEKVHNFVISFVKCIPFLYPLIRFFCRPSVNEKIKIGDLTFKNPIGLAAGFDKNCDVLRFWDALGFGFAEIGTVTPLPQAGNPKPRLFRLVKDTAIINRMGFNNTGADEIKKNLLKAKKYIRPDFIVGVNIGKNKNTSLVNAVNDYLICLEKFYDCADYFTVNISSPNTEGLRDLQGEKYLDGLLFSITDKRIQLEKNTGKYKMIFLKIAPDLTEEEIKNIFNIVCKNSFDGIIVTNTTTSRQGLISNIHQEGGLSGKPLKNLSDVILNKLNDLNRHNSKKIHLIASGGIFTKSDIEDKIKFGAELVEIYTGFIYEGPCIVKKLLKN
jgi:dihydroorotate dehydrogenase